jgi:hypothetical protein
VPGLSPRGRIEEVVFFDLAIGEGVETGPVGTDPDSLRGRLDTQRDCSVGHRGDHFTVVVDPALSVHGPPPRSVAGDVVDPGAADDLVSGLQRERTGAGADEY